MIARTDTQIAVQVAVEAIVNNPYDYDSDVVDAVRRAATAAGTPSMYVEMLPEGTE